MKCITPFIGGLFVFCLFAPLANAETYINKKVFDYPDLNPLTSPPRPRLSGCAKWLKTNSFECKWLTCHHVVAKICLNPTHFHLAILRHDVFIVVSGPKSPDQAVKKAVAGYAEGCVAAALAATGSGPQIAASPAVFYGTFYTCIQTLSIGGVVGAILSQFQVKIDLSRTHWSDV